MTKQIDAKEIINGNILALIQQNQNLQSELDKAIKDNRKLVKELKNLNHWLDIELKSNYMKGEIVSYVLSKFYIVETHKKGIEEVLKKVGEDK